MTETTARPQLSDRYTATSGRVQLTGVQALVRLPLDQHRRDRAAGLNAGTFVSGYEGSPLAGYDLELGRAAQLLDAHDVMFSPGLNEELAATAVQGSQLACTLPGAARDGVTGFWYGKAPGLDRATDALRHGNLMGTAPHGRRAGRSSATTRPRSPRPCRARRSRCWPTSACPYLVPGGPAGRARPRPARGRAVAGLRAVGRRSRSPPPSPTASATVDLGRGLAPALAGLPSTGAVRRTRPPRGCCSPRSADSSATCQRPGCRIARRVRRRNGLNRIVGRGPGDRIGIVAAGQDLPRPAPGAAPPRPGRRRACAGSGVRLLELGMVVAARAGRSSASSPPGCDEIVVVEEKRPFLEAAVKDVSTAAPARPPCTGKRDADGVRAGPGRTASSTPTRSPAALRAPADRPRRSPAAGRAAPAARAAGRRCRWSPRTPYFCSGCPHNTSTKVAPEGSLVGGGHRLPRDGAADGPRSRSARSPG